MNRKQFLLLLVLVAVIGGIGLALYQRQNASYRTGGAVGQKLLPDFPINDVARITLRNATAELNLAKQDDRWVVRERNDYPANFEEISSFVRKAGDLKIVQSVEVGPSKFTQLELVEPGKEGNTGTLVEFKGAGDKPLARLLLGKKQLRKSETPSPYGDDSGHPVGRYVLVLNGSSNVAIISDALSNIEPRPEQWVNKDFFKVEKIKAVSVTHPEQENSWSVKRDSESGEWQLADAREGETLDAGKISGLSHALSSPSFSDVAAASANEDLWNGATTLRLDTFDDLSYTLKTAKKPDSEQFHLTVSVAGNLPGERPVAYDEKDEDKEKLDQEFQEKRRKIEEKLRKEKAFEGWTYEVSRWTLDPFLKQRSELLKDPTAETAESAEETDESADEGFDEVEEEAPAQGPKADE